MRGLFQKRVGHVLPFVITEWSVLAFGAPTSNVAIHRSRRRFNFKVAPAPAGAYFKKSLRLSPTLVNHFHERHRAFA